MLVSNGKYLAIWFVFEVSRLICWLYALTSLIQLFKIEENSLLKTASSSFEFPFESFMSSTVSYHNLNAANLVFMRIFEAFVLGVIKSLDEVDNEETENSWSILFKFFALMNTFKTRKKLSNCSYLSCVMFMDKELLKHLMRTKKR